MAQEEKFCATCEKAIKDGNVHEVCTDCMRKLKAAAVPIVFARLTDAQVAMMGAVQGLVNAGAHYVLHQLNRGQTGPCPLCPPVEQQQQKKKKN